MRANPIVGSGTPLHAWNTSRHLAELPVLSCETLVPEGARAVIIAPHPDDEILGCGGLMRSLAQCGRSLKLISVTNGSASHPGSQHWTAERLSIIRPLESAEALRRLGINPNELRWVRGGFPDSGVAQYESELREFLTRYLRPDDVVFTTWRDDGHTDHEAVGRASAAAALDTGAILHEIPIWAWHWATPEDFRIPWERACKIPLDSQSLARKKHAMQAFASQLQGDADIGLAPVLSSATLDRLQQPFEVVFL
ncbi:PIG-L deacetylase family protein [Pseudomonas mangiferae]|uniref:PIG-L family deacetylase n=1 Tax=Pseudomonas mangiferae TaxID=2593654 RepID=A0A553GVN4_9PSED|nr:PIG-L family deacetylase [Pseudomonas mangiferae]TRX73539.1 PIG-L family deacetylase [Pseudomonas mangiferae]